MCAENDDIEDLLLALLNHSILIESLREKEPEASLPTHPAEEEGPRGGEETAGQGSARQENEKEN
jgi:hypothetical protein